ncbi:uncharacterized protein F5Z01DRAFT_743570 [Emericellopsis atlantica]|uniref:RNA polymerase II holoenzyme cyclin-like subunit n=1 Tax=Emericellopsis atlantica TaxID=2614577 RepID=A0A9P7ZLP8_9HYPO|nr:uncharacterized protein F5Z01DRAFT_743570 [Emericellopsis atlantica]KAG9253803.1 hypothetical protein F5Z01DRAFT_743570 [Emericellopsis atlantica]
MPPPTERQSNGDHAKPVKVGPHPGHIRSSNQYTPDAIVRSLVSSREDIHRLQGVSLLNSVRTHLQLPVRTFATSCIYFHRFRLSFRDADYSYQDAAMASLFVACKVEDTIKKSREILAAAHNIKNPDKPLAPDDKVFEGPSKVIIGLERLILETIGFDFRTRYPQKLLVKTIRHVLARDDPTGQPFFATAYAMSIDMYKTFIPIKRTTFSMVMAIVELTARLLGGDPATVERAIDFGQSKRQYSRPAVMETILDLLDLYIQHPKSTRLGTQFDIQLLMDIKIKLNRDLESKDMPRHLSPYCPRCEATPSVMNGEDASDAHTPSVTSPATPASSGTSLKPKGQDSTMRFVFDPEAAGAERDTVRTYFTEDFEEYEVEVDEPIPPPPQHPTGPSHREDTGGGRGRGRGGHR